MIVGLLALSFFFDVNSPDLAVVEEIGRTDEELDNVDVIVVVVTIVVVPDVELVELVELVDVGCILITVTVEGSLES
jgi:hypothetical protein